MGTVEPGEGKHEITVGSPTEDERRRMPSPVVEEIGGWGCLTVVFVGAGFAFRGFLGWLGSLFGPGAEVVGEWVGVGMAFAMFCVVAVPISKYFRRQRAMRDEKQGAPVEEIRVECRRAVRIEGDHSSIEPGVCIDIGEGKLLLLVGQWLEDPDRLGVPRGTRIPASDDHDAFLNRLPAPWSFPAVRFTLRRLAKSGDVLSLRPEGPYLEPDAESHGLSASDYEAVPQSAILVGTLDDIAKAMRKASPKIVKQ